MPIKWTRPKRTTTGGSGAPAPRPRPAAKAASPGKGKGNKPAVAAEQLRRSKEAK